MNPLASRGAPLTRQQRQAAESDRFARHEYQHSKVRKARRQVRLHRYQWAVRRGFAEARLAAPREATKLP